MKFLGALSALRNSEYIENINNQIDNLLAGSDSISIDDLKHSSIFANLNRTLNKTGKSNLNEIASLDGNKNSLNKQELTTLFLLLDGKKTDNLLEYDGKLEVNNDMVLNSASKSAISLLYENIKIKLDKFYSSVINIDKNLIGSMQVPSNCWMLSQFNGYSMTDFGKEIISEHIVDNKDGTYTVNFDGYNKSYTFNNDNLLRAKKELKYSVKNDTVLLLEKAFEKLFIDIEAEHYIDFLDKNKDYFELMQDKLKYDEKNEMYIFNDEINITRAEIEENHININDKKNILALIKRKELEESGIHGAYSLEDEFDILKAFTGENYNIAIEKDEYIVKFLKIKANNPKDFALFFNSSYNIEENLRLLYEDGSHVYSIGEVKLNKKGNIKYIEVINPHDSSKPVKLKLKEFMKYSKLISPLDDNEEFYDFYGATSNRKIHNELIK